MKNGPERTVRNVADIVGVNILSKMLYLHGIILKQLKYFKESDLINMYQSIYFVTLQFIDYENLCHDEINYCHKLSPTVCTDKSYLSWSRMNCRKFCNLCAGKPSFDKEPI